MQEHSKKTLTSLGILIGVAIILILVRYFVIMYFQKDKNAIHAEPEQILETMQNATTSSQQIAPATEKKILNQMQSTSTTKNQKSVIDPKLQSEILQSLQSK